MLYRVNIILNKFESPTKENVLLFFTAFFRSWSYFVDNDNIFTFPDDHAVLQTFSLDSLFPHDTAVYYRYHGSLTTPPCFESVIWTIFKKHIIISEEQVCIGNYYILSFSGWFKFIQNNILCFVWWFGLWCLTPLSRLACRVNSLHHFSSLSTWYTVWY
jgi:hypothetical protein